MAGEVDVPTLTSAMSERERWLPPLTETGVRLHTRLLASVDRQDEGVLSRLRRRPDVGASLLAFLPALQMLELFAAVERADERMLGDVEQALPPESKLGRAVRARVGFLRAISAMSRVMGRTRAAAQVSSSMQMRG